MSFAGAETIAELISFPDMEGDVSVALHCALHVQSSAIFSSFCLAPDSRTRAFEESLKAAMPRLRVSTARLDGRRKPVWIPYSVEFLKRGDDEQVRLYQNYGTEAARYGSDYTGPQRVLSYSDPVSRACETSQPGQVVWVRATVTADGQPEGIRVVTATTDACRDQIEALFADSSYIPAHVQGKPVSAELLEPFFPALDLYGDCHTRTQISHGQNSRRALQDWSEPRSWRCKRDEYTGHEIS
jgi:hypothetical protein